MLVQNNYQPNYYNYNCSTPSFNGRNARNMIRGAENTIREVTGETRAPYNNAYSQYSINRAAAEASRRPPKIKGLKKYINDCSSGNIDPAEIEKRLLKAGAEDITEAEGVKFQPSAKFQHGRKKKFRLNGKNLILESHDNIDKNSSYIETRLYTDNPHKQERYYLTRNGEFLNNIYESPRAHLESGLRGKNWMGKTA